jgi:hypothetical protein
MRDNSGKKKIEDFITEISKHVKVPLSVYFNGGATAVMFRLRETTIDVDLYFEPDEMQMYKAIQLLKEELNMNIELAAPHDFVAPLSQWRERSLFITTKNKINFFHYDLYSQIISKVQRGWKQDLSDAQGFLAQLESKLLIKLFKEAKPGFIKYPAVDVNQLEKKLGQFIHEFKGKK